MDDDPGEGGAEYNEVTGTPAGAPLKGAVYEISEVRSGKVVDYITTDARGVAMMIPEKGALVTDKVVVSLSLMVK